MEQIGIDTQTETARAERVGLARAQQAWVRTLAEHHRALTRELHALDEQVRALGILKLTLAMNRAEWLAQLAPLVRAEGEVLAQAHADQRLLHCLLLSAPPAGAGAGATQRREPPSTPARVQCSRRRLPL